MINGDLCHEILVGKTEQKLAFKNQKDLKAWKEQLKEKFIELSGFDLISQNACDPELEIGRVCVQLASPDFKYMNGETLTLEGGMGLRP